MSCLQTFIAFGHWRVYGRDLGERFASYIPDQPVLAYLGEDPVTGEWADAFLLPKSPEGHKRLVERLCTSLKP